MSPISAERVPKARSRASKQKSSSSETSSPTVGESPLSHVGVDRQVKKNIKTAKSLRNQGNQTWWNLVSVVAATHALLKMMHRQNEFPEFLKEIGESRSHGFAKVRAFSVFESYEHIDRLDPTAMIRLAASTPEAIAEGKRLAECGQYVTADLASQIIRAFRPKNITELKPLKIENQGLSAVVVCHPRKGCSQDQLAELQTAIERVVAEIVDAMEVDS